LMKSMSFRTSRDRTSGTQRGSVLVIAALVLLSASSTGCFWLAVGGAGAVGYQVAKDDRSIGTKIDDASITTGVKSKLIKDSKIDAIDINVDTFEGVVTLHGNIQSRIARTRAMDLARSVKGVSKVKSKLVIVARGSK
jgi:hyperosmotically inducible protein